MDKGNICAMIIASMPTTITINEAHKCMSIKQYLLPLKNNILIIV